MRITLAAVIALASVNAAQAADPVQVIVHSAKAGSVYGEVLVEVKNLSERTIQRVAFNCGLFAKSGSLTGADDSYVTNLPPKESEYKRLLVGIDTSPVREVDSAKCRVTAVR